MVTAKRVYVRVLTTFDDEGYMHPVAIKLEDGKKYMIDKITDVRPAAAQKAGGQGDRYTVYILGKESYLFFEHAVDFDGMSPGRWFVEQTVNV